MRTREKVTGHLGPAPMSTQSCESQLRERLKIRETIDADSQRDPRELLQNRRGLFPRLYLSALVVGFYFSSFEMD